MLYVHFVSEMPVKKPNVMAILKGGCMSLSRCPRKMFQVTSSFHNKSYIKNVTWHKRHATSDKNWVGHSGSFNGVVSVISYTFCSLILAKVLGYTVYIRAGISHVYGLRKKVYDYQSTCNTNKKWFFFSGGKE